MPINSVVCAVGGGNVPVKIWAEYLDEAALKQVKNLAKLPFIHKHVAVMADAHAGNGSTIGSVIATKGAIIPAAVGVDIGCGMVAALTNITASDLPDSLLSMRNAIEAAVPHGRTDNGRSSDVGRWNIVPDDIQEWWGGHSIDQRLPGVLLRHPKMIDKNTNTIAHMGTLGTGNHFIEVCLDERERVWILLHSGSRGVGNRVGSYFIEKAKEQARAWISDIPDASLAFLPECSPLCDDYLSAMRWCQDFAYANRQFMLSATVRAIRGSLGRDDFTLEGMLINCHHNYASKENHYGQNVWVTRKGAIRARTGELGVVPGSMGDKSYIVEGKGNEESFTSCSHGAGRAMSRTQARKLFDESDLRRQTFGIECRKDAEVVDEIPSAYKRIERVMAAQNDLVSIVHSLTQVVNVKG